MSVSILVVLIVPQCVYTVPVNNESVSVCVCVRVRVRVRVRV